MTASTPQRTRAPRTMTPEWTDALDRYEAHARPSASVGTLRVRMGRVRRLAIDLGGAPGDVTREQFEAWAAQLPCTVSTTGDYVKAARAFYKWATRAGVAGESPLPSARVSGDYRLEDRWADAVASFERAQLAASIAPGTIKRRVQHVRRFAVTIGSGPWQVRPEDYGAWILQQEGGDRSRASLRDSLRAFYRWASKAGRIDADPTIEQDRRALRLGVPSAWEADIHAWRRWMIGAGTAPSSVGTRVAQLEAFARSHPSAQPFDLTADDIYDYMAGKQWARETRRGFRVAVRAFYRWAVETGRTEQDPTELMPRIKTGDPRRVPATSDEYHDALAAARDPRWQLALRMGCELGMRRGEVAQARSSDLRPDPTGQDWLSVRGKGGKVRTLPVPANLAAAIRRAGDDYLFPSPNGGHTTAAHLGKQVSRLLPPGVSMHALRHAFATRAYRVNRDVLAVQRLLGHASAATTQRYVQVPDEHLRALVEAVAL